MGELLAPGERKRIEVSRPRREVTLRYSPFPAPPFTGAPAFWKMTLKSTAAGNTSCFVPSYSSHVTGQCQVSANEDPVAVRMLDPPGTDHTFSGSERQSQAAVLANLCRPGSQATCVFVPKHEPQSLDADPAVASGKVVNCDTQDKVKYSFDAEHKTGTVNSVEAGFSYEFETNFIIEKAKVSVEFKYGHKWIDEHTFRTKIDQDVKPQNQAWVELSAPVVRLTGDFHLELANTTWNLTDVYFDHPDPAREGQATYYVKQTDATLDQKRNCAKTGKGILHFPASAVTITRHGSDGHDVLRGGPESNVLLGQGGMTSLSAAAAATSCSGARATTCWSALRATAARCSTGAQAPTRSSTPVGRRWFAPAAKPGAAGTMSTSAMDAPTTR